jgi:hypothetical protein
MRKRRVELVNNKYIIVYNIKLIKKQTYLGKEKLYD